MSGQISDDLRGYYLAMKHQFETDTAPLRDDPMVKSMRSEAGMVIAEEVERDICEVYRRAGNRLSYMLSQMRAHQEAIADEQPEQP